MLPFSLPLHLNVSNATIPFHLSPLLRLQHFQHVHPFITSNTLDTFIPTISVNQGLVCAFESFAMDPDVPPLVTCVTYRYVYRLPSPFLQCTADMLPSSTHPSLPTPQHIQPHCILGT